MAYQSLYRRYRSQKFSEIKGQPHVTDALRTAVAEGRYGHAYLFSGPRGTGKTSTARVLAKALNCENLDAGEPCGTCKSCIDIESGKSFDLHELDAASNNKVDDIRELIAKVALGSPGRTKVYILDEVHMLTSGAENALLKTLEEPPPHVVFVLATTEPHKVVPTIRSRTQHFEFHLLPGDELAEHVRWVVADAGLDVDQAGIEYALRQGGGSARDTLSALDLVAAAGGVPAGTNIGHDLAIAIGAGDPGSALVAVQRALETGREPRTIGEEALSTLRDAFLAAMGAPLLHLNDSTRAQAGELATALGAATITRSLEQLGQALVEMRQAPDPRVPLEVTLLRLARRDGDDTAALLQRIELLERQVAALAAGTAVATQSTPAPAAPAPAAAPSVPAPAIDNAPASPASPSTSTSTHAAPPPASPRGPAADARQALAEKLTTDSKVKPMGSAADDPPRPTTATGPPPQPAAPRSAAKPTPDPQTAPPPESPPSSEQAPTPPPTVAAPVTGGGTLSYSSLRQAVHGGLLEELEQRVRVRFKMGEFVDVDAGTVTFAVPNDHVIPRCEEVRSEVEAALSRRFGQPVTIAIVVDPAAGGTSRAGSTPTSNAPASARPTIEQEAAEITDIESLENANDVTGNSIERLTQAFPGSTVIQSPSD